ncbi:MAG TPA: endonuclease/exonuclease/phosphatase family protein [Chlamydiales bacterium]|nr:endonuclease/exonuclease/phosphatase family protein [Chlamydiales bacterium]
MTVEILEESSLDRTLLDLSSKMAEPLCWAYGLLRYRMVAPLEPNKFDNCDTKIAEIATRALIAIAAATSLTLFTLPTVFVATFLGVGSRLFRAVGFALQKKNYTYVPGALPEKELHGQAKIMTWNVCGVCGGMHYDHGGVISWRSRIDRIVDKIIAEDPDVLVLQEIYDTALAEAIVQRLNNRYAHFFLHLGANSLGSVSGEMVLSKCAVHRFTNTSFTNNEWTLNRTFASIEIKNSPSDALPCARIIGTHLIHDDNAKRMVQVAQIVNSVAREALPLPTVLTGDLNLERDKPEEGGVLDQHLIHGYTGREPTCTNQLVRQWDLKASGVPNETIDYVSLFRNHAGQAHLVNTHLVRAFDALYDTKTALSDHNGVAATLTGY